MELSADSSHLSKTHARRLGTTSLGCWMHRKMASRGQWWYYAL